MLPFLCACNMSNCLKRLSLCTWPSQCDKAFHNIPRRQTSVLPVSRQIEFLNLRYDGGWERQMKVDSGVFQKLDRVQLKFLLGSMKGISVDRIKGQSTQELRLLVKDAIQSNIDNNQEVFVQPGRNKRRAFHFISAIFGLRALKVLHEALGHQAVVRTYLASINGLDNRRAHPFERYPNEKANDNAFAAQSLVACSLILLGLSEAVRVFAKAFGTSREETLKIVNTLMSTAGTDLTSRPEFTTSTYETYKKQHSVPCKALADEKACAGRSACEWRDRRCRASRHTKLKYKPANPKWGT